MTIRQAASGIVVALILLVGLGILLPAVVRVREAAGKTRCQNNFRQIGLALGDYYDSNDHFPSATRQNPTLPPEKRLSWLFEIGPFVEASPLCHKIDRELAWDAEENRFAALTRRPVFQCPAHPERLPVTTLEPSDYIGMAGIGADAATLPKEDTRAGFLGYDRSLRRADIKDGLDTTLAVAETLASTRAWTGGGWATVRGLDPGGPPYVGVAGQFGSGHYGSAINVLYADGSVRSIPASIDPRVWEALATINGREEVLQEGDK